jgi:uncharacterized protein (DUF3820 family)
MIGKPTSEFKCLTCEFITKSRANMMEHQLHSHAWFFNEDTKPELVSQMGHVYWHVKVLDYAGRIWETISTRLDPNEEKLPTGNLTDMSLMPFGKHKGEKMSEVPVKYLHWLYTNTEKKPFNTGVFTYIKKNKKALEMEDDDLIWIPKSKN